jgi:hypothetical protein
MAARRTALWVARGPVREAAQAFAATRRTGHCNARRQVTVQEIAQVVAATAAQSLLLRVARMTAAMAVQEVWMLLCGSRWKYSIAARCGGYQSDPVSVIGQPTALPRFALRAAEVLWVHPLGTGCRSLWGASRREVALDTLTLNQHAPWSTGLKGASRRSSETRRARPLEYGLPKKTVEGSVGAKVHPLGHGSPK